MLRWSESKWPCDHAKRIVSICVRELECVCIDIVHVRVCARTFVVVCNVFRCTACVMYLYAHHTHHTHTSTSIQTHIHIHTHTHTHTSAHTHTLTRTHTHTHTHTHAYTYAGILLTETHGAPADMIILTNVLPKKKSEGSENFKDIHWLKRCILENVLPRTRVH